VFSHEPSPHGRLQDFAREQRGDVKSHELPASSWGEARRSAGAPHPPVRIATRPGCGTASDLRRFPATNPAAEGESNHTADKRSCAGSQDNRAQRMAPHLVRGLGGVVLGGVAAVDERPLRLSHAVLERLHSRTELLLDGFGGRKVFSDNRHDSPRGRSSQGPRRRRGSATVYGAGWRPASSRGAVGKASRTAGW